MDCRLLNVVGEDLVDGAGWYFFTKYIVYLSTLSCGSFSCLKLVLVGGFFNMMVFFSYLQSFFIHGAGRTKQVFVRPVFLEKEEFGKGRGK